VETDFAIRTIGISFGTICLLVNCREGLRSVYECESIANEFAGIGTNVVADTTWTVNATLGTEIGNVTSPITIIQERRGSVHHTGEL